jgi:cytochrome P450
VDAMSMIMVVANVPYMSEVARLLPNPIRELEEWLEDTLDERQKRGTDCPDVFGFLLDEDKQSGWKHTREELISDAMLMVIAGADTSSVTMCLCLYHLIVYPEAMSTLRKELESVFGKADPTNFDKLAKECPYLNAIIDETLRLYPPVASGLQRETPSDSRGMSLNVHGTNIAVPHDVIITTPTLTMHRDARNFSPKPDTFRPERWLKSQDEEAFNRTAFNPFSYGPTSCVGRTLAYMEIRIVVASIVTNFDMSLDGNFDAKSFPDGLMDIFTTKCTQHLPVRLQARAKAD